MLLDTKAFFKSYTKNKSQTDGKLSDRTKQVFLYKKLHALLLFAKNSDTLVYKLSRV